MMFLLIFLGAFASVAICAGAVLGLLAFLRTEKLLRSVADLRTELNHLPVSYTHLTLPTNREV